MGKDTIANIRPSKALDWTSTQLTIFGIIIMHAKMVC